MAAAPVEICQFVVPRSLGGRLGSYLYMVSRLHRMRRRFEGLSANSLSTPTQQSMNYLAMASRALGEHQEPAYAVRATTHHQTYPERPPGADLSPQKVCNLDPMAPRSRKKRQLPEDPQEP